MKCIPISTVEFGKILADETRQKIMAFCCCQRVSVGAIAEKLGVSQPTVSHHLRVLREAGLVAAERDGKEVYYSLNQERLAQTCCQVAESLAPEHPIVLVAQSAA